MNPDPDVKATEQQKPNRLAGVALAFSLGGFGVFSCGILLIFLIPYALYFSETVCASIAGVLGAIGAYLGMIALLRIKRHPGQRGAAQAILSLGLGGPIALFACWIAYLLLLGPTFSGSALYGP